MIPAKSAHSTLVCLAALAALSLALTTPGCFPRSAGTEKPAAATSPAPPVVALSAPELPALLARRGHRTIVNLWATWCGPCREEMPALLRVARAHRAEGVRLVLISADFPDQLPAVRAFLAKQGVTDTTYMRSGEDMAFLEALDPRLSGALPATLVLDEAGRKIGFWEGESDEARFERAVHGNSDTHPVTMEHRP